MKPLLPLVLCSLAQLSFAQHANVPIILSGSDATISLGAYALKVEVNHQPVEATSLTSLSGQHLLYVVMNDGSAKDLWPGGIKQQAEIVDQFLKDMITPNDDVGTLINFGDEVYIDVINDKDPQKLSAKLERTGKGSTNLNDALISTVHWLAKQATAAGQRRVIFLFADGDDNASTHNVNQTIDVIQRSGIPLFIIAPASVEAGKQGGNLSRLANEVGGKAYFVGQDPKQAFDFIKRDLQASFLLQLWGVQPSKKMQPLQVTDTTKQVSITAPSAILVVQ